MFLSLSLYNILPFLYQAGFVPEDKYHPSHPLTFWNAIPTARWRWLCILHCEYLNQEQLSGNVLHVESIMPVMCLRDWCLALKC